jgi:hypothetical protein
MAAEQELAGPFAGGLYVVIDRLASLFAQFKSNRAPCFLLADGCAIHRVSTCRDIPLLHDGLIAFRLPSL